MKLVIIEDHLIIRDGVKQACVHQFGHEVVGVAASGAEGVDLVCEHRPDAVVLDLGLPDMSGFVVAEIVQREVPGVRVLVLSGQLDPFTVWRVERSGVHGFVDKGSSTVEAIGEGLAAIGRGKTYFSPTYQDARRERRADTSSFEKVLSRTEQDVLALVGEGLTDQEIGRRMGIAPATAQTHRSKILQKLEIKGTPKLVAFAIQNGFTRLPSRSPFLVRA